MALEKFTIDVPEKVLGDLKCRLAAARWPDEIANAAWERGTNLAYLRALVAYWQQGYDWRAEEAALNRLPQYRVELEGARIHFVHVRGQGPNPLPLIISHGWPGSFVEMTKLIQHLADPAAHGGRAEDAFDVVVPSLPGYGFSDPPLKPGINPNAIAALWVRLMATLGYERFAAQGGDWGAAVTTALGLDHPQHIVGLHLNYIAGRFLLGGTLDEPQQDAVAQRYLEELRAWWDAEGGYNHLQATKPQTLGYALNDSPLGLAAWILEKFHRWSDCAGDPARLLGRDALLTNVMIYWVSATITASMRLYYETRERPLRLSAANRVAPPVAVALFPKEIPMPPRALAERGYNIQRWTVMPRGGHFAAMEQPELLAQDLREFFRDLR
jgi:pimeloyl-ACP methyl ester carboxylesterase